MVYTDVFGTVIRPMTATELRLTVEAHRLRGDCTVAIAERASTIGVVDPWAGAVEERLDKLVARDRRSAHLFGVPRFDGSAVRFDNAIVPVVKTNDLAAAISTLLNI